MAEINISNKTRKIEAQSLNNIREKGKYFLTLTLSHNGIDYKLPNEPLISLSLRKTIVETPVIHYHNLTKVNEDLKRKKPREKPIQPRTGTIKEYISTEDYSLTIRGVCIDENDNTVYPSTQVQMLNELANINEPLLVKGSKFLTMFNIYQIVIKDIHFDEMEGKQGLQTYLINAVSNEDFYADLLT